MPVLYKYRWLTLCLVLLFCVTTIPYVKRAITPNNAISIWFNKEDPALRSYEEFQDDFGNDRVISLAFKEDSGILRPQVLKKIQSLSHRLGSVYGVKEVSSIITAKDFRRIRENDEIRIRFTSYFEDSVSFIISPETRKELLTSPLIVNRFINSTGNMTVLIIKLDSLKLVESQFKKIIPAIEEAAAVYPGKDQIHMGGSDVISYGLNVLSQHDFGLFAGLCFLLMFFITGILYRRLEYIVLVVSVCLSALIAALSIFGMLGLHINIFSVVSPPLIISLGIISIQHIINEYENLLAIKGNTDTKAVARQTLINIFKPALFAGLTTTIGFASLFTSATAALKEFGLLSSIGMLLLLVFSFVFSIVLLPFQKNIRQQKKIDTGYRLGRFSKHILHYSFPYSILAIVVVSISIIGIQRINNDMDAINYFPKNNSVVSDHAFMLQNWGEYYPMDMELQSKDSIGFADVNLIQKLVDFHNEVDKYPIITNSLDFTTLMDRYTQVRFKKRLEQVINDPFEAPLFVAGFLEQFKEKQTGLLTPDLRKARITFTGPLLTTRELEKHLVVIDSIAKKHFDGIASLTVSGYPSLYIKAMNYAFESMESSLYTSLIMIFTCMVIMLGSIRTAIVAIIPNIFPVLILLGFLGFSGINLDLATCTVTAIVIGIAIDDTIYFLHNYRKWKKTGLTTLQSIQHVHRDVGKVILVSSLVLIAGFSLMLLASLKTVIYFGLLAIISVASALIGDLVILPLLLKYSEKQKVA